MPDQVDGLIALGCTMLIAFVAIVALGWGGSVLWAMIEWLLLWKGEEKPIGETRYCADCDAVEKQYDGAIPFLYCEKREKPCRVAREVCNGEQFEKRKESGV